MNFYSISHATSGRTKCAGIAVLSLFIWTLLMLPAVASPPNPGLVKAIQDGKIATPYYLLHKSELNGRGIDNPGRAAAFESSNYTGTFNILAILIQFSDKPAQATATSFDTLLFTNQQGSLRHFYNAVSYGHFDVVTVNLPSQVGWATAPQTYAYYCNNANGTGLYPNNSQRLCEDVVNLIDPLVDFSDYDNDNDGVVDGILLIHTGPGAEMTGLNTDIWSHQWVVNAYTVLDGVRISSYSIQPEYWFDPGDMTCGVYCHEFGHILGLPDLYDTTPSSGADSYGIGLWSLMAYGSWNGSLMSHGGSYYYSGDSPAEFDAWCRLQLGFAAESTLTENVTGLNFGNVESGGNIYRINVDGASGNEYFLLENRQKTSYDSYLPGAGLLIWHIDETQTDNNDRWFPGYTSNGNYMVALEQADGLFELEQKNDQGDAGDPFPGSTSKTSFSPLTTPSSDSYAGDNTATVISNISPSASTMTADVQVSLSSGTDDPGDQQTPLPVSFVLGQNYPNPFNPVTRINLELSSAGHVTMTVYDLLGRTVNELIDEELPSGYTSVEWDGRDSQGNELASGVYFYEVVCDGQSESKKMLLLR